MYSKLELNSWNKKKIYSKNISFIGGLKTTLDQEDVKHSLYGFPFLNSISNNWY